MIRILKEQKQLPLRFMNSILVCIIIICYKVKALPDGLHKTPPMGWTSWNAFFTYFNEEKMMEQAIALQDLGLDELGYEFLTIDDQWHLPNRDAETNRMIANPEKFPSGIRFLADFMHERGLKIGIYSSAGRYTCSCNLPGSLEFEEIDVQMMLDFEIDYFKVDFKLRMLLI